MQRLLGTGIGKVIQSASRLRGGGQALPGLVVEKLFPTYFAKMLRQLPEGVVVITGTNGKTTTTKMVVELLRAQGKKVVTNPTGSNLTRGIVSSLIKQAGPTGKLPYDLAVFEIDEAYARHFVKQVKPRWVLALNVSRDQLDRFGEVDVVAQLVGIPMRAATVGVVTNANDPRLAAIGSELTVPVHYIGVAHDLQQYFPTDNELVAIKTKQTLSPAVLKKINVELTAFEGSTATYAIDGQSYVTNLQLTGQHNFQNAAGALALVQQLLPDVDPQVLTESLSRVTTAFGRGEIYHMADGSTVQLVLVKNPSSFRQSLASYLQTPQPTMIVINDNYADSRDVSWLWDVDFMSLKNHRIAYTSGSRASDMALRLHYDDIVVDAIEPDINQALAQFCHQPGSKIILATYTAMLHLHDNLTKKAVS